MRRLDGLDLGKGERDAFARALRTGPRGSFRHRLIALTVLWPVAWLALAGCDALVEWQNLGTGGNASPPGTTTTFVLIRHAERDPGLDPPLNAEGMARAEALKQVLEEQGVTAIWATDYLRNRQTVEPIAEHLGIMPTYLDPLSYVDTPGVAHAFIEDALRDHAGGVILFCGNVGTIVGTPGITESIYEQLGGTGRPPNNYRDLYIAVVADEGPARFIKTIYGEESSLD